MSALSRFGVIYVATHDSIFLGEDGPTHQPIEMNASLRAMPNMYVFRPADGNEVSGSYAWAIEHPSSPSVLALTRQTLPNLEGSGVEKVYQGAYVLQELTNGCTGGGENQQPDLVLLATGSEVSLAVEAGKQMMGKRIRIVSMPCQDLFDAQPLAYKQKILLSGVPVLSIEASATFGWHQYAHAHFGLDRFGASAPIADLKEKFGFNAKAVEQQARAVLQFYHGRKAPCLFDRPAPRKLELSGH